MNGVTGAVSPILQTVLRYMYTHGLTFGLLGPSIGPSILLLISDAEISCGEADWEIEFPIKVSM